MASFCSVCGKALNPGAKFCDGCGAPVAQQAAPAVSAVSGNLPQPGYSSRVNDPEIKAAIKKSRGAAKVFTFFLVPLPLIGFLVYSLVSNEMETSDALLYGAIISGIFLIFALYGFIRERASNSYEATVIDKKKKRYVRNNSDNDDYEYEYITVVRTTEGKKKKIREHGGRLFAYNYLEVGDRFRYHPQFHFPYEHYDKSKAKAIYCVGCQTANPVSADRCSSCGLPLLK